MVADVKGTRPNRPRLFRLLSGSEAERVRVLMELGMLTARRLAVTNPTLLILDSGVGALDNDWLKRYGQILTSPAVEFQTVASLPLRNVDFDKLRWGGWRVIWLDGKPPNVTIQTNIRAEKAPAWPWRA